MSRDCDNFHLLQRQPTNAHVQRCKREYVHRRTLTLSADEFRCRICRSDDLDDLNAYVTPYCDSHVTLCRQCYDKHITTTDEHNE